MHAKNMSKMKNKHMLKAQMSGPPLKPLYSVINKSMKGLDTQGIQLTRNMIVKASEEIEILK